MKLFKKCITSFIVPVLFCSAPSWAKQLHVITTTPDLASIAREIGGDQAKVDCLASPVQDPHFVDAKPSMIVKLMNADLFIETGMELEIGWAPLLVQNSGNPGIQLNANGHLDASRAITPLEVPESPTRAMGDVHPAGNPHYLTDPENGKLVAKLIADKMGDLAPKNAEFFQKNLSMFQNRIDENMKQWKSEMEPYRGSKLVSYHKDIVYFIKRFNLVSIGEIEPKPGIPPTAQHTANILERMKAEKVSIILNEPWHESRTPESIAKATGATVVTMDLFPGTTPDAKDYMGAIDHNVQSIVQVLSKPSPR